jgi:hypothetical protein
MTVAYKDIQFYNKKIEELTKARLEGENEEEIKKISADMESFKNRRTYCKRATKLENFLNSYDQISYNVLPLHRMLQNTRPIYVNINYGFMVLEVVLDGAKSGHLNYEDFSNWFKFFGFALENVESLEEMVKNDTDNRLLQSVLDTKRLTEEPISEEESNKYSDMHENFIRTSRVFNKYFLPFSSITFKFALPDEKFLRFSERNLLLSALEREEPMELRVDNFVDIDKIVPIAPVKQSILASMLASGTSGKIASSICNNGESCLMKSAMMPIEYVEATVVNGQQIRSIVHSFEPQFGVLNKLRKEFIVYKK